MATRKVSVEIVGNSADLERAFKRSSAAATGFDRSMRNTSRGVIAATASFTGLRRGMLSTSAAFIGGAGLTAALASTVKLASSFEQSMNVLQAVTKGTTAEMAAASKAAQRLGADITLPATSAADAATAMTELAKGGLSMTQAMEAARGTLQLAAAAGTDVGTAAAITARQLNAFGLSGNEASKVADVLANSANAATGEITDFAIAFQQSSSVAHQFGLSVEDTAAALSVMAKAGLIGSDAGTSLRVMLTRLVPQTAKAVDEMQTLGVSFQDAQGNLTPFRKQIAQYQAALAKLTPAQRQLAVQVIFGTDAQRAANIIFNGGVKAFDQMRTAVSKQGGAQQLAAARSKGFAGAVNALKSAIETTQISLGLLLLPTLTAYLKKSATWLGDTENQKRLQKDFSDAITVVGSALKVVVGVVKVANEVFKEFAHEVGGARNAMVGLAAAVVGLKFAGMLGGFKLLTAAAGEAGAAGAVKLLRTRLLLLSGLILAPIVIPLGIKFMGNANQDPHAGVGGSLTSLSDWAHALNPANFGNDIGAALNAITGNQQTFKLPPKLQAKDVVQAIEAGVLNVKQLKTLEDRFTSSAEFQSALTLARIAAQQRRDELLRAASGVPGKEAAVTAPPGSQGPLGLSSLTALRRNQLALAAAARTKSTKDDLKLLVEQRGLLATAIKETQAKLSGATGKAAADLADTLQKLFEADSSAMGSIVSINEAAAADAKSKADKIAEAARKAREAARKAREAILAGLELNLTRAEATPGIRDDLKALKAIGAQIRTEISTLGSTAELQSLLFENVQKIKAKKEEGRTARADELSNLRDFLSLNLTRAQTTPGFANDLKVLNRINDAIEEQIKVSGKTPGLLTDLFSNQQAIKEARQHRFDPEQFKALGLSATGEELLPSQKALRSQANKLGDAIKGTFLDTPKTRSVLAGVRKALSEGLKGMSDDVKSKIKSLLDDLAGQLGDKGPLPRAAARSSAKIAEELTRGLGIDKAGRKQLQQNILAANISRGTGISFGRTAAVGPHVTGQRRQDLHVHVDVDGREVAKATINHINKAGRQSATQTSGRNAGNPNRFG